MRLLYERFASGAGVNVLVAHSFGCTLAVRLIASIKQSAHVAPPKGALLLGGGAPSEAKRATALRIFSLPLCILRILHPLLSRGFRARALHPDTTDPQLLGYCDATSGANPMHVVQPFYCQAAFLAKEDALMARKRKTAFACLCGEGDKLTPPESCRQLARHLGGTFATVPRAAHQVMQEQPEAVNRAIERYL